MTRVTIIGDSDSSHVEKNGDSSHVFHRMTPLESQSVSRDYSQSHFKKISEFPMDKPRSFAHKELSIFCFSGDKVWQKFSVLPV